MRSGNGTLTKWLVGVIATALVGGLGYFTKASIAYVGSELQQQHKAIVKTNQDLALYEYRLAQQEAAQKRFEEKLDRILERLPERARRKQ